MKKTLQIATLCFLAPFLIELQSGNIPLRHFFQPATLVFLMTVGYGLPLLIIREVYLRYRLGLPSLILLGIMYGFYNEGLIARTLLRDTNLPINAFDGEVMIAGLNLGFTFVITMAHALQSILYPIIIFGLLFPGTKDLSLMPKRLAQLLGVGLFAFGTLSFFRTDEWGQGTPVAYLAIVLSMVGLWFMALRLASRSQLEGGEITNKKTLVYFGAGLVSIVLIPSFVALLPIHPLVPALTMFLVCYLLWQKARRLKITTPISIAVVGIAHMIAGMMFSLIFLGLVNPALLPTILPGFLLVGIALFIFNKKYVR